MDKAGRSIQVQPLTHLIYICVLLFFYLFFNHKNVSHHEFQFTSNILTGKGNRKMCRNRSMFLKNTGVDFYSIFSHLPLQKAAA